MKLGKLQKAFSVSLKVVGIAVGVLTATTALALTNPTTTTSSSSTSTSTASSTTTTSSTPPDTSPPGTKDTCFTSTNVTHVSKGRAHISFSNFHVLANGSNQDMGSYSIFVTTTLKMMPDHASYLISPGCM
ncbi:MAG: hypothetical protein ACXU7D_09080 [Burkholderiaceae bacterium]